MEYWFRLLHPYREWKTMQIAPDFGGKGFFFSIKYTDLQREFSITNVHIRQIYLFLHSSSIAQPWIGNIEIGFSKWKQSKSATFSSLTFYFESVLRVCQTFALQQAEIRKVKWCWIFVEISLRQQCVLNRYFWRWPLMISWAKSEGLGDIKR